MDVNHSVPWLRVDQDQKYFGSQITIIQGIERAKKPSHATVPLNNLPLAVSNTNISKKYSHYASQNNSKFPSRKEPNIKKTQI